MSVNRQVISAPSAEPENRNWPESVLEKKFEVKKARFMISDTVSIGNIQ